ncbi:MAG: dienelactone hydrolase family protein [Actinobacteria bacterium]|nr:dienelactone hydrolase family protein [Actinomycetota bacterium]
MRTEQVALGDAGSMSLFVWDPPAGQRPKGSILLIQEIFGVGPYIRAVGERLAAAGYLVGAPDVFWRFAPNWASDHDEAGLGASLEKVGLLDFPLAIADCTAALGALAAMSDGGKAPAVMGFCMGGTLAWAVAAAGEPSCCVSYYGSGVPDMLGMLDQVTCPTLFHFGNADAYIPNEGVDALSAAIAGRDGYFLNVEDAGHAFDNHESAIFWNESAAKSAWAKTMSFLTEHA